MKKQAEVKNTIKKIGLLWEKYFDVRSFDRKHRKHFLFNISLGLIVMICLIFLENTMWGQQAINQWFDAYINMKAMLRQESASSPGLIFLEVDDIAWRDMGRPDKIPRDKLAKMVDTACMGGARLILLDYDLSLPDESTGRQLPDEVEAHSGAQRDQLLREAIIRVEKSVNTTLLLPGMNYADKSLHETIYDDLIDDRSVFSVTPGFSRGIERDSVVRFWMPYLIGSSVSTGGKKILWSVPVMTMAVLGQGESELNEAGKRILSNKSQTETLPLMINGQARSLHFYLDEYDTTGLVLRNAESHQYNRIYYALWPTGASEKYPYGRLPANMIGHWRRDGIDNTKLDYAGKIVIIGRSDRDCDDFVWTPSGRMPGMYVHGNSIYTLLGTSQPHLTPMYKHVLIECLLIILAAYAFLHLPPVVARLVLLFLFIACWVLTAFYFYWSNEFVNLSFAFMGIGIHDFVSRLETLFER